MSKEEIIKVLRDMAKYPTVTLPRDSEALKAAADLLAQPEQYAKGYADAMNWKVQNHLEHLPTAQPVQEPVARCCLHDSDCAVHNMPAYPNGPCNCSQTFVSSPDLGIVTTVAYQLAERELKRLVEWNFGYMPRNDEWADKVLLARDTFEAAHNIGAKP